MTRSSKPNQPERASVRFNRKPWASAQRLMVVRQSLVVAAVLLSASALPVVAQNGSEASGPDRAAVAGWSQFRGAHGNGKSTARNVPIKWSPDENIKWRTPLPGPGDSSPIISGDRVFITCAVDKGRRRTLYCLDRADGKELWSRTVEFDKVMPTHKTNPYCASTPLVASDRVIVWHGSAGLFCYDLNGEELWSKDLGEFRHIWGYAASPILYKDRVILNCGPGKRSFMAAFDPATGKTLWQTEEPGGESGEATDGERRGTYVGSWSTPVVAHVDGRNQILCSMPTRVNAYDPDTGEIVWYCEGLENQPRGSLAYTSPVIAGDVAIAMGGFNGPAIGLKLGGRGNVTKTNRLWRNEAPNPQRIGSGVIVGRHMYIANAGAGIFQCLVVRTGEEVWRARIPGGNAWGSIVMAEDRLYVTAQNGNTVVFAPNPEKYEEISVNPLNEASNSTPALADGQIFVRTFEALYCIEERR